MAVMTMRRSIAFSRATASAICSSSSRLALTAIGHSPSFPFACALSACDCVVRLRLRARLAVPRFGAGLPRRSDSRDQRVGEHQPRLRHVGDRQQHVGRLRLPPRPCAATARPRPRPRAGRRGTACAPRVTTAISTFISWPAWRSKSERPHQRPVDPGRGHFQPVLGLDRVLDVEHRRERARSRLAILDRHRAVRPLRHDLHRAARRAGDAHAHQPIAEARRAPASASAATRAATPCSMMSRGSAMSCDVDRSHAANARPSGNKKERVPGGAHSQKPIGSSDRYEMSMTDARHIALWAANAMVRRAIRAACPGRRR